MQKPVADYLKGLYAQKLGRNRTKAGRLTYWQDRPKIIRLDDGLDASLEHDDSHHECKIFDRVSIRTPEGVWALNEITGKYVFLQDVGDDFEYYRDSGDGTKGAEFRVIYGSESLAKSKKNLYVFLHELGHVKLSDVSYENETTLEPACWGFADASLEMMGVRLFESDEERILSRDVHLRTYDPFNEFGLIKNGLMSEIDQRRFEREVLRGLGEASRLGLPLKGICENLIMEYAKSPSNRK